MSSNHARPYCFIDFDGTLVDNKYRMYKFCCDYCCESFSTIMTIDEYWTLKRLGVNELDVVNAIARTSYDQREYGKAKLAHMEDDCYLEMDELIPGSLEALSLLRQSHRLVLVTRREHPDRLKREVERLDIRKFFSEVVIIPHGAETKAEAIRSRFNYSQDALIVGDTEDDILAGVGLGIKSVFVLSGIRSIAWQKRFSGLNSIYIFDNLLDFALSLPLEIGVADTEVRQD